MNPAWLEDTIVKLTEDIYEAYPDLMEKYGERGKQHCMKDLAYHFEHLDTAYALDDPKVFKDYGLWLNNVLVSRGMKPEHLIYSFERIRKLPDGMLPAEREGIYRRLLDEAIQAIRELEK